MTLTIKKFDKILDENPEIEQYLRDIYNHTANWKIDGRLELEAVMAEQKAKGLGHCLVEWPAIGAGGAAALGATSSIIVHALSTEEAWHEHLAMNAVKFGVAGAGMAVIVAAAWVTANMLAGDADFTPKKTAAIDIIKQRARNHNFS